MRSTCSTENEESSDLSVLQPSNDTEEKHFQKMSILIMRYHKLSSMFSKLLFYFSEIKGPALNFDPNIAYDKKKYVRVTK